VCGADDSQELKHPTIATTIATAIAIAIATTMSHP